MCAKKSGRVPGAGAGRALCAAAQTDSAVRGIAARAARRVVRDINLSSVYVAMGHIDNNAAARRLLTAAGGKQVKVGKRT
jgi:hypothetical protein